MESPGNKRQLSPREAHHEQPISVDFKMGTNISSINDLLEASPAAHTPRQQSTQPVSKPQVSKKQTQPTASPRLVKISPRTTGSQKSKLTNSALKRSSGDGRKGELAAAYQESAGAAKKSDKYVWLNTSPRIPSERQQHIEESHSKILEKDSEGKVKRVKFEAPELQYSLGELFEKTPTYNEPVPDYRQL